MKSETDIDVYLTGEVRTHDRARYLCAVFAKAKLRPHLMALLAFDIELSRIHGLVSEPALGAVRYQWWRDQIRAGENAAEGPVAQGLLRAMVACDLPRDEVIALVDGHERGLDEELDDDEEGLGPMNVEAAAHRTYGQLHALMARALGEENSWTLDIAREAGAALGMARFLRDTPDIAELIRANGSLSRFQSRLKVRVRLALRTVTEYGAPDSRVLPALMAATLARHELREFKREKNTRSHRSRMGGNLRCMLRLLAARISRRP